MKDLYSHNTGMYIPSFFCMKIDSDSFGEEMIDRELSLFVHEYIHFLQNITTTCGIERLNYDLAVLCRMIEWIKEQDSFDIEVPFKEENLKKLTKSNKRINDLTWGETGEIEGFEFISAEKFDEEIIDEQRTVESIGIKYRNKENDDNLCSFGTREIYESMAYLIEQHITKDYEPSPNYPYKVAQNVIEYIHPQLLDDYRNLLILYDKALMSSNPGSELYNIVQWLKYINYIPHSPEELFEFLNGYWEFHDLDKEISSYKYYVNRALEVKQNLHVLLQDDYFKDYHSWVDQVIGFAIFLRKKDPLFWLKLVNHGYIKKNPYWEQIISNVGTPLIETKRKEYFVVDPIGCDSYCMVYFKIFNQIYRLLSKGETQCLLMPWCNDSRNQVNIDATCHTCPWKHGEKNGDLCLFKGIWQHWGLNEYNIWKMR